MVSFYIFWRITSNLENTELFIGITRFAYESTLFLLFGELWNCSDVVLETCVYLRNIYIRINKERPVILILELRRKELLLGTMASWAHIGKLVVYTTALNAYNDCELCL